MSRDIVNGCYSFSYLPTQWKVLKSLESMQALNYLYSGGFGSGKTRLIGELAWELMLAYPGIEIGVFRKTRVGVYDTTYKTFTDEVIPPEYILKSQRSTLEIWSLNGSYAHFFGIDNFAAKGSLRFDVILIDEATELEEPDFIMLQGRLRGKVFPRPAMVCVCNPGPPAGFLYEKFVQNAEKPEAERDNDYAYFSTDSFENIHNPEAYFERLRKWEGTQYYARYVLGQWVAFKGLILDSFDPKIHVIKPFKIPYEWPKYMFVDFGYDNPMVMGWVARDPKSGTFYLYRQFYKTRTLVRDAIAIAKQMCLQTGEKIEDIVADHDAENRAQFEQDWIGTIAARKDVAAGIQALQEVFLNAAHGNAPGFYIFNDDWSETNGFWYGLIEKDPILVEDGRPTCMQEEAGLYKWGKNDVPVKENDHSIDGARYLVYTIKCEAMGGEIEVYGKASFARR